MVMERGEIWWAEMPDPAGSAVGFRRPIVIISANMFNRSRIRTIIVAAITSNLDLAMSRGNFKISEQESGLPKASVVNVSQILTLDKDYLTEHVGTLSAHSMEKLNNGLLAVFDLKGYY